MDRETEKYSENHSNLWTDRLFKVKKMSKGKRMREASCGCP